MIPCSNPGAAYQERRAEIDQAILRVLASGHYILGPEVRALEQEFSAYIGTRHALGVASGTDALVIALRTLGIGPGDEVITASHTAVATAAAIELAGATPVFADIEPAFFTIDPADVERRIGPRTKAIVPVHIYGQPADLSRLLPLARRHGLRVIEDCAQAHGARHGGQRLGSLGDIGCFSCYPTKNLGAIGDAGLVVTNDPELAERARALREYGWNAARESQLPGMNTRLDELQAAILRVKLAHLDADNQRRADLAKAYAERLADIGGLPTVRAGSTHVYHLYVIRTPERDALKRHLQERGVLAGIHYPMPVHLQSAYRGRHPGEGLFETERAAREVLSLPLHPELGLTALGEVAAAVTSFHARPTEDA